MTRIDNMRRIRAARGTELSAKSWLTEAPLRMLMNNLDPEVAERPGELVVYGGIGRAARDWDSFDRIVGALRRLEQLIQEAVVTVPRPLIAETIDLIAVLSGRGASRRLAELARIEGFDDLGDYIVKPAGEA